MCGLVMVLSKNSNGFSGDQRDLFTTLLFVDTLRGKDSTGAFLVNNLGNVDIAKQATSAQAFIDADEYKALEKGAWERGWAMVGHNRAATRGEVTDANAHPFVVDDNIVLVHNGTFSSDHKKLKDTAVDSEVIAHMLSEHPTEEALRKIHAAYALIWYNVKEKKISFIRNAQRPLWFCETHSSYIITSEESIMRFGMDRFHMKPANDKTGPFLLKENYLVEITLNKNKGADFHGRDVDVDYWKHNKVAVTEPVIPEIYPVGRGGRYARGFRDTFAGLEPLEEWDDIENDIPVMGQVHPITTPSVLRLQKQEAPWGTKGHFQRKVIADMLGQRLKGFTYNEWKDLEVKYEMKGKVKVVVYDMIEADENPKTTNFLMIGETLDPARIPVVFPMTSKSFETVIEASEGAIFEVEFNGMTWQAHDKLTKEETIENESVGLMLLHGMSPVAVPMAPAANA